MNLLITSEKEKSQMNSTKSTPHLKHGEEPTELLVALASSPIETLVERGQAIVYTANTLDGTPGVLVFIANTRWVGGLVLATVGNQQSEGLPTLPAEPEQVLASVGNVEKSE